MISELEKFKALLDDQYTWPAPYLFKFIVPSTELKNLEEMVEGNKLSEKPSKNGKYTSVSFTSVCNSSDEVIQMYQKVSTIPGILSL
ncbi:DUF493 domain-containing protein [Halobacteriovorax marinus]|uniref:DUF493 family protein n=1 Tax=Halobacteriovorax marinus TaxID=97084 RepID=UPI000BC35EB2|nr:DUF493 family protein [Halobacteriovorax marinus]ATH08621.1 DUF493 domain-containing protein [Halobacteriovorax marinus]